MFRQQLREAGFQSTSPLTWTREEPERLIKFQGHSDYPEEYIVRISDKDDTESNAVWKSMLTIPSFLGWLHNEQPALIIITWDKYRPEESQKNWHVDLGSKTHKILNQIVKTIEEGGYMTISISCEQGTNAAVAVADLLKKHYYPHAEIRKLN